MDPFSTLNVALNIIHYSFGDGLESPSLEIICKPRDAKCSYEHIRIYHEYEGRIEKSVPIIAVWHH